MTQVTDISTYKQHEWSIIEYCEPLRVSSVSGAAHGQVASPATHDNLLGHGRAFLLQYLHKPRPDAFHSTPV